MLNKLTENAKELINNNKLQEAENLLLGLEDKYSIFELARIRKIQGRNKEAEQLYLKSLSMPSEIKSHIDSDINIELGRLYGEFGKLEEAKARYEKGADRVSLENNIYRELGEFYLYTRSAFKFKEAAECFEKAIKLFPNDIRTSLDLAVAYRVINKDDQASKILNGLLARKEVKTDKFLYNKVLNQYEILMGKEYLESKPREIRATITTKCNIGCRYCSVWRNPNWELPEERIEDVMNHFPYLEDMQWLGGEAFLYDGFEEILEEGSRYDRLHQTIMTNGLLLNERILEKIAKGNVSLIIAIDAGKKETYEYLRRGGNWDKLCRNLELIKEVGQRTNKKIETTFNAVLSKTNYKEMFDMLEMAHKYDFNRIRFMSILGDSDENIWLNKDVEAIKYIKETIPFVEARARDYNIFAETDKLQFGRYKDINLNVVKDGKITDIVAKVKKCEKKSYYCVFPWTEVVIDSKGLMRMCPNCNDWLAENSSIAEFWNCEGMQLYRKKLTQSHFCYGGIDIQPVNNNTRIAGPNDLAYPCYNIQDPCHGEWDPGRQCLMPRWP